MFYQENQINELITCPYCKNKYNDPRVMECGASFCMSCIDLLKKEAEQGFECPECDEFHQEPPKGFFKNLNLAKICEKKAAEVSRGTQAHTVSSQLGEIQLKLDKLVLDFELGVNIIKDFCNRLRNEVKLTTEQTIEHIKKLGMGLIQEVDKYETKSVENFEIEATYRIDFNNFVTGTYEYVSEWASYLKQHELDDSELKQASDKGKLLIEQISKEDKMLLRKVFKDNVIEFSKVGLPDTIGKLTNSSFFFTKW